MGSSKHGRERQTLMEMRRLCYTTVRSLAHGNYLEAEMRGGGRNTRRINGGSGCQESQTLIPAWQDTVNREFNLLLH